MRSARGEGVGVVVGGRCAKELRKLQILNAGSPRFVSIHLLILQRTGI